MSFLLSEIMSRLVYGGLLLDGCVHRGNNTVALPTHFTQ
jgi:hypothetical protein